MRKLYLIALFVFSFFVFISCLEDCADCREVTRDSGGTIVSEGSATNYCGAELDEKEAEDPVTIGDLTTRVECD